MSEYVVKAMDDLYGNVSFNRNRGSGGGGPTRNQMGGRGGPGSQQEAVRLAQRYHATGSFAERPTPMTGGRAIVGSAIGGAIAGAPSVPGMVRGAVGGAIGAYIATR